MPAWIPSPAAGPRFSTSASGASSATTRSTATSGSRRRATAHKLGLKRNCTMLYGHIETEEDRVDHLVKLRALQDETGGFSDVHSAGLPSGQHAAASTSRRPRDSTDIKNIAVARLMLDNIPHIKAYWIMMTPRIAQIAQRFGADDLDGTVVEERIYHDAGATTSQGLRRGELLAAHPQGRPASRSSAIRCTGPCSAPKRPLPFWCKSAQGWVGPPFAFACLWLTSNPSVASRYGS